MHHQVNNYVDICFSLSIQSVLALPSNATSSVIAIITVANSSFSNHITSILYNNREK